VGTCYCDNLVASLSTALGAAAVHPYDTCHSRVHAWQKCMFRWHSTPTEHVFRPPQEAVCHVALPAAKQDLWESERVCVVEPAWPG